MTQIAVSDEVASSLEAVAASRGCSTEEFLKSILSQLEDDEAFAQRLLTPAAQARMLVGLERAERGKYLTSEDVDRKFEALYRELESR